MKSMWIIAAAAAAYLAIPSAQAACIYPRAPEQVPDGRIASKEEMKQAVAAGNQFNEDINSYNACLDMEMKALETSGLYDEPRLKELAAMRDLKHNAAVDAVETVAGQINEQIRIFNAREKKDD